jgi:hypothetical protein
MINLKKPKLSFPFRHGAVLLKIDFEEPECIWSFWVETGIRSHGVRLSRSETATNEAETIAYLRINDGVLEAFEDEREDAESLSEQLIDMLSTLASKQPPEDCLSFLRWRLCEAITDLRRKAASRSG